MKKSFVLSAIGVVGVLAGQAGAQWTVVRLNPENVYSTGANGVGGGQQVGAARDFRGFPVAVLWSGDAGSMVSLRPGVPWALYSQALGVRDGRQVGYVQFSATYAALWSGSAASYVDLHPEWASSSVAYGVDGGQQAGVVDGHAGVWSGSASSWVDLNPEGASGSAAYAVHDGVQVGQAEIGGFYHAAMWAGSPAGWVDLNPAGATGSWATGVFGGRQVGVAVVGGANHACVWKGSAGSWVDLNPPGADASAVEGVYEGFMVGRIFVGGEQRAYLWVGDEGQGEDLSLALPGRWRDTRASAISVEGSTIHVVGDGYSLEHPVWEQHSEALLWTRAVVVPPRLADFNGDGFTDFFDYDAFVACFEGAPCPEGRTADFDGDGFTDFADYDAFVAAFETGA